MNRYNVWGAGARFSYDFGPCVANVWAVADVHADAAGGMPVDKATVTRGYNIFTSLSFKLWSPEPEPAPALRPSSLRKKSFHGGHEQL
ncbi:hypothetical protein [Bradyrhizobium sp. Ash2021]|uniref:hypothetical protein n=1 Tax=Bradyrhizobium sp. Ash2021 TaxID=2954771 RepID=UPI0028160FCC|nr:hypothetical protein [Bradyrhizobium sp. Ash2021]WMT76450.1 hypothetical protein NL528_08840 [Bradyrhizobium sp. Ash2021]